MGNKLEILRILSGSYVGLDYSTEQLHFTRLLTLIQPDTTGQSSFASSHFEPEPFNDPETEYAYVLALCPMKPIVWEGQVVHVDIDSVPITDMNNGQLVVISKVPYFNLDVIGERFLDLIADVSGGNAGLKLIETRCSLAKVQQELKKMNRAFSKCVYQY